LEQPLQSFALLDLFALKDLLFLSLAQRERIIQGHLQVLHLVYQIQRVAPLATPDTSVKIEVKSLLTSRNCAIRALSVWEAVKGLSRLIKSQAASVLRVVGAPREFWQLGQLQQFQQRR
jgi:hypothetical protein